jgi:putative transposase
MSRLALYIHIVWATEQRHPLLTPPIEEAVYKLILTEVRAAGYETLALNGMPDHVHLLLQCGPQIDLSLLMKKVKGLSSAMVNEMLGARHAFRWQEGYYAATVTPSHLPKIRAYVENQKNHHRNNTTSTAWENEAIDTNEAS